MANSSQIRSAPMQWLSNRLGFCHPPFSNSSPSCWQSVSCFSWHRDAQRQYLYSYAKPIASTGLAKHLVLANKACPREIPRLTPVKYYSLFRSLIFTENHQTKNDGCSRQEFAGDYGCTMASQLFLSTCPAYLML